MLRICSKLRQLGLNNYRFTPFFSVQIWLSKSIMFFLTNMPTVNLPLESPKLFLILKYTGKECSMWSMMSRMFLLFLILKVQYDTLF